LAAYEQAFALDPTDARVFFELDQLRKKLNHPPAARLAALDAHAGLVARRDDLTIAQISLLNWLGRHDEAYARLMARQFHPWEGGEGKVTGQYMAALVEQAKAHLAAGDPRAAIDCLKRAQVYPHNLGEGKLHGAQENNIFYHLGEAYAALGDASAATAAWERAATGLSEPSSAMFYNDQPPDMIYYQGLARRALGREDEAQAIFRTLIDYGHAHMDDDVQIDYFAVSLPDFLVFDEDLQQRNQAHCHYMIALGHLGQGNPDAARAHLEAVLALRADHLGARVHGGGRD
jgi:tetratricopeptide (TPR) repeat protein